MDKTLDKIIKKHIILTCLTAVAIICMMVTITYGLYQTNHKNTVDQEIAVGAFDVNLTSNSGQITLTDLNPGDEPNTTYTFTTSNSGDYTVAYNVYFNDNTNTFLENSANAETYANYTQITTENFAYINYSLDGGVAKSLESIYDSTTGKMTILSGRLEPGDSHNHTITFSISSNAPNNLQGTILALNITMDASASKEFGVDKILKLATGSSSSSTEIITKSAPEGSTCTNTLAYDGTEDNNLRYVGNDPCNYVSFNNELWRIIGVMNNVDDGTGKKEVRLKLVRNDSLGTYSWDSSSSSINSGWGINDWTQADLKNELNGDYLNTNINENQYWYDYQNNQKNGIYDYTKAITNTAQNMIGDSVWYLGGAIDSSNNASAANFYRYERGTTVWGNPSGICNDGYCPRSLDWTGKVALLYPSDYAFAVGGNIRASYITQNLRDFGAAIKDNNWLYNGKSYFFLTPSSYNAYRTYIVYVDGFVGGHHTGEIFYVYPSIYLKTNILIISGDGSINNPYILE